MMPRNKRHKRLFSLFFLGALPGQDVRFILSIRRTTDAMKTTSLPTDSAASVTPASAEAHDAKPTRKVRVSKKAPRGEAASTAKKGKAPRGVKAEKAPRKSRKATKG